jgi:hypothetical protein
MLCDNASGASLLALLFPRYPECQNGDVETKWWAPPIDLAPAGMQEVIREAEAAAQVAAL